MSNPSVAKESTSKRRPLSVWELPKLLHSVHRYRKSASSVVRQRPHYTAILAFIHRNRFAVASQIQRRFGKYLRSDRTTRRHLAEMESLGDLGVAETNNTSPLWPKVYFVTRRGLAKLKQALREKGQEWSESSKDRGRSEGQSAQHVLHEIFITEFLLMAWDATQTSADLEILTMQRRSLAKHDAFKVVVAGRSMRLQPDGMFLYRQQGKGMMCCFVEMDLGSMSLRQLDAKFRRYQSWSQSANAMTYLKSLYSGNGACNPTASFRILMVIGGRDQKAEQRRLAQLFDLTSRIQNSIRNRIWLTTIENIRAFAQPAQIFDGSFWMRHR